MHPVPTSRLRILSIVAIGLIVLASIVSVRAESPVAWTFAQPEGGNVVDLDVRPPDFTVETALSGLPVERVGRNLTRLVSVDLTRDATDLMSVGASLLAAWAIGRHRSGRGRKPWSASPMAGSTS